MHHKSWSNLRKILEEDRLAPALRGRVQYFMTRYHDAHDDEGRLCIRVDGKEYLNSCFDNIRYQTPDGVWHWREKADQNEKGLFDNLDVLKALDTYLDELSLDEALASDNPLIRLFAVLDRRVGKRRLPALAAAMETEPEWLQFFYWLRLDAEGYKPHVRVVPLSRENFDETSLDAFLRHQVITECWCCVDGAWALRPVSFVEDWDLPTRREKAADTLSAIDADVPAFGAFDGEQVVGVAQLGERLGSRGQYVELDRLHVSEPWRGKGVGRRLFAAACDAAINLGAEKLYISAHPARESQAAYRAWGCVHAAEVDPVRAAKEPYDVPLEYDLRPLTIRFGEEADLPAWMALVRRVAGNFPGLETEDALQDHAATVAKFVRRGSAICALRGAEVVGVLLFSPRRNQLCCMAVAPESRRQGVAQGMFRLMLTIADPTRDLTVTTFREGDPKAAAPRAFYEKNGFLPADMVVESGYPCQVFVRPAFRVERLTEALLPALFAYERRLSEEEPGFYRWTEEPDYQEKVRASFREERFGNALSFVAVTLEGEIVGRIDAALLPSHFDGSVKAYLDWLCVLKSWRHHGVAQALMAALRRELSAQGVDTLVGLIAANDEAQRFYRGMQNALIRDEGIWIDC